MKQRHTYFALFMLLTCVASFVPLCALLRLSIENDAYSHVGLIPLVSVSLIYLERRKIFARVEYGVRIGMILVVLGVGGLCAGGEQWFPFDKIGHLSFMVLSLVLVWTGGFICCYGVSAFQAAAFPALFLLLMVPIPGLVLDKIVFVLQKASTETAYALFRIAGVPVLKNGFVFALPGVNIRVAQECSGIRSSWALLITSLLAGHLFLRSTWRKASLSVLIVPITVFKNAVRIATLSLLSVYVNRGFLTGNLHHYGGIPFSIVAVAMLVPPLWWLQRSERHSDARQGVTRPMAPVQFSAEIVTIGGSSPG